MIILGLTGSIGMGKSTASAMLEHLGVPTHDSDAAVHDLMQPDQPGMNAVRAAFPYFSYPQIYKIGWWGRPRTLNRQALGKLVFEKPELRETLERIIHPLVREAQRDFIRIQRNLGRDIVALDIPLLFETGADKALHYTINVTAPAHVQRRRVLARSNMSEEKFARILDAQMQDGEKSARADFVVQTGLGRAVTMRQLKGIVFDLRRKNVPRDHAA